MQITVYASKATTDNRITVSNARTKSELEDRISDASASVSDIGAYLRKNGLQLDKADLLVCEYALARARYREGDTLNLRQLALLAGISVQKVTHYLIKCVRNADMDHISSSQASMVLSNIADY